MVDLNALLVFSKVAEALSFTEAARRLGMPVSTVSRRVAELEEQLSMQLVERSTRTLRLTRIGLEVLDFARRAVDVNDGVDHLIADARSEVRGLVRLAAPPSISDSVLTPLITAFCEQHGRVRFEAMITEQIVDFIGDGVDLEVHVGPVKDPNLVVRRLLRFRHRLVASPAYLSRVAVPEHPRDLAHHPILAFSHFQPQYVWHFSHVDGRDPEHVTFEPRLGINDYTGVASGLLAGGGIGDLPPIVRPDLLRDGSLVEVMPDWHLPVYDLALVHPATRYQSRAVRMFMEFAEKRIGSLFTDLPT
jgi:DNA-binding transcriptional LysR family regulator